MNPATRKNRSTRKVPRKIKATRKNRRTNKRLVGG